MHAALQRGWDRTRAAATRLAAWGPVALVRAHPVRWILGTATATVLVSLVWATSCGLRGCPTDAELRAFRPSEGGRVLDRNGRTLGFLKPVRRLTVPLDRVPTVVQQAFIAVEDRRFYAHDGIDWQGAVRAVFVNITSLDMRQGSSTLTMQAARTAFLERYEGERSLRRKLIELHLAGRLEHALTKSQILELYLNTIYLGDGIYGVDAASRHYFGKSVAKLSLPEAALLAGLPRAPSSYDPRRYPQRARARRDLVIGLMQEQRFITAPAAAKARATPLRIARDEWHPDGGPSDALDLVRAMVDSLVGTDPWKRGELVVQTTFDLDAQRAAERAVMDRAAAIGRAQGQPIGAVQGAMVALDPQNGELLAIVGASVMTPGGLNRALTSRRQPGSAFKPFVYAAALERGYTPATMVDDEPITVQQQGRLWQPANYGDEYRGTVTLQDALVHSLNAATVRVSQDVGLGPVVAMAQRAGITSPLRPLPSLALGSAEVTPMELVRAYAPFGNGGWKVTPSFLLRISSTDGTVRWQRPHPVRTRAMDERDAFVLTTMLQAVVDEGTATAVRALGVNVPAAGKTGTTNDGTDVWFVGYTRTLVAGFWFGYDTPRSLGGGASGGRLAAPAWAAFYKRGWKAEQDYQGWDVPPGVVRVGGETNCGFLGLGDCTTSPAQWMRDGAEPAEMGPPKFLPDELPVPPAPPDAPEPDAGFSRESPVDVSTPSPRADAARRRSLRALTEVTSALPPGALTARIKAEIRRALREAEQESRRRGNR